jgi:hypothetical protein
VVKSWCDPRTASRMELQSGIGGEVPAISCVSMKTYAFLRRRDEETQARTRLRQ